ncbi:MAG TPA: choice-of-anchor D domain-containing protein [Candidatus Aquilonibacter sp.]|nr:choice-of-anchor D domain-containing protein [Candidatus Aquilonibacter sp.]
MCRVPRRILPVVFLAPTLALAQTPAGSSSTTTPSQTTSKTVWTNDNISGVGGTISVVGGAQQEAPGTSSGDSSYNVAPNVQVLSPTPGAVFAPGQTVDVSIRITDDTPYFLVGAIGPEIETAMKESKPFDLDVKIKDDPELGPSTISVIGAVHGRNGDSLASIPIDIERDDMPTRLIPLDSSMYFEALGEQTHVDIIAQFADGHSYGVDESPYLSLHAADPAKLHVGPNKYVTMVATGNTSLTVVYSHNGQSIQTTIPATMVGPELGASPLSLDFGNVPVGTSSDDQEVTITNETIVDSIRKLQSSAYGDYQLTDDCNQNPVPPHGSCTIRVTFKPTAIGNRDSQLRVSSNLDGGETIIALRGSGTEREH